MGVGVSEQTAVSGPPLINATALQKRFGHVYALRGIDFDLAPNEIHAIVGDNGAGKSTFVKILSGVHGPDSGTLEVGGKLVRFQTPRDAQEVGIETVYQDLALASTLDSAENIFLGREIAMPGLLGRIGFIRRAEMRRRTSEELSRLGIKLPSVRAPTSALSGGQRQAVAVARAAVWGRRILILDEPTAALGTQQTEIVLGLMQRVRDEGGLSLIFISHNLPHVFRVADRITVLRLGERVLTCAASEATSERLIHAMTHGNLGEPPVTVPA
jgi:ABC-type sugar transport system ATPase subunit